MFARLVNERCSEERPRIEIRNGEAVEPGLVRASQAANSRPPAVPQRQVDAVGTALAEEQRGHGQRR